VTAASSSTRLPAAERRQALVEAGLRAFSARTYRGVTTAEIAREAGVSEPILYRHFASKRDLYLACLDEAWSRLRSQWEEKVSTVRRPEEWRTHVFGTMRERKGVLAGLWTHAFTEAVEDPEIRRYLRGHIRQVHDAVAEFARRAQAEGIIPPDRDPEAEAWIFVACMLLGAAAQRVGGLMNEQDWDGILAARRRAVLGDV
jgi:AcrR family transcriptional regulator